MNRILTCLLLSLLLFAQSVKGETRDTVNQYFDTLVVGLNPEPPFIIKQGQDQWRGASIHLWENVAEEMDVPFKYREFDLDGLQDALENKKLDLAVTPMAVTGQRLQNFHFSQPFFISNLTVAVQKKSESQLLLFLSNFVSVDFLQAVMLLFFVILVFGLILWLVEKKANPEMFAKGMKGIWDGIWWSAVTMTTVGYGDKAPKSNAGKVVAMVWMFTAIIIISTFTASITSSLTINTLEADISEIKDLKQVELGTVTGSTGESYIEENGWQYHKYPNAKEAVKALGNGKIEALVYDAPIMNFLIHDNNFAKKIKVLPFQLSKQYYSFSMPKNSPLRDKINPLLVRQINTFEWKQLLKKYNLD